MIELNVGDVAHLGYDFEVPDADEGMSGEFVDLLVVETDGKEVKGLVMSHTEHYRVNPIAVLVTESRFDASVDRSDLFGDQLIWILMPVSIVLKKVVKPVLLERVGRVTPIVLEEVRRKIAVVLSPEAKKANARVVQEFDDVRNATECALANLEASKHSK